MANDSIYITGWEYNRLLADSPTVPMLSGLPGAALYDGGFQFWLFRNTYCTKESFDLEARNAEALEWGSGQIYKDLKTDGFLKPYSWSDFAASKSPEYSKFLDGFKNLQSAFSREALIAFIESGDLSQLEAIKLSMLRPLFEHLNCVADLSPDAVFYWKSKGKRAAAHDRTMTALREIAAPVTEMQTAFEFGMTICHRPGSHASLEELNVQRHVEDTIELPMVPALLSGRLKHEDFLERLAPYRSAYEPISRQLAREWSVKRKHLNQLRDAAEKYIWPDLHGEWLPRLQQDPDFHTQLKKLLRDSILRTKIAPLLNKPISLAILAVSAGVAVTANTLGGPFAGAIAGGTTKLLLDDAHKTRMKKIDNLTLFYQAAKKFAKQPAKASTQDTR